MDYDWLSVFLSFIIWKNDDIIDITPLCGYRELHYSLKKIIKTLQLSFLVWWRVRKLVCGVCIEVNKMQVQWNERCCVCSVLMLMIGWDKFAFKQMICTIEALYAHMKGNSCLQHYKLFSHFRILRSRSHHRWVNFYSGNLIINLIFLNHTFWIQNQLGTKTGGL